MKNTMKKILSMLLAVIMLVAAIPYSASAAKTNYYTYEIKNGEATITDVDISISGDVTIPSTLGGYPVTTIGYEAFKYRESLTSITIPDSVTTIENGIFLDCPNLTSITVDENNKNYSNDEYGVLFNKEKTELLKYPEGNKRTEYTIPDTVTTIGYNAFQYCENLANITIPSSVTTIDYYAFWDCRGLTNITVDSNNIDFSSDDFGVLFNKEKTELLKYPKNNKRTSYTIPDSVESIGGSAFWGCDNLTEVTVPESVITIGGWAFYSCSYLTSIAIPENVTTIGDAAFSSCRNLNSITIPDSVTAIGYNAFIGCDSLTSVTIPESVVTIGDSAFLSCNNLTNITVDKNNKNYSSDEHGVLFNKEKTELIAYPSGNERTVYNIPDSVTTIGDSAFFDCVILTGITIPDAVTTVGLGAFSYCESLTDVYYKGTKEQWKKIKIEGYNEHLTGAVKHYSSDYLNHYSSTVIPVTCEKDGCTLYTCGCGYSYQEDIVYASGHKYDSEGYCSTCGESKIENCSCNCHKSGIMGIIWKILRFFYKLFGMNKTCACGVAHY